MKLHDHKFESVTVWTMCFRYSLTSPPEAVRAAFGYADTPNFSARYNIAPTQPIAVVLRDSSGARRFRLMRWGLLLPFVKDPKSSYLDQRPLRGGVEEAFLQERHTPLTLPHSCRRLLSVDGTEGKASSIPSASPRVAAHRLRRSLRDLAGPGRRRARYPRHPHLRCEPHGLCCTTACPWCSYRISTKTGSMHST